MKKANDTEGLEKYKYYSVVNTCDIFGGLVMRCTSYVIKA